MAPIVVFTGGVRVRLREAPGPARLLPREYERETRLRRSGMLRA